MVADFCLSNIQWQIFQAYSVREQFQQYINMYRKWWVIEQPRNLSHRKRRELGRENKLAFCGVYNASTIRNLQSCIKRAGSWRCQNTLPTIVHGQAFRIITWQSHRKSILYLPPWCSLRNSTGYAMGTVTGIQRISYIWQLQLR